MTESLEEPATEAATRTGTIPSSWQARAVRAQNVSETFVRMLDIYDEPADDETARFMARLNKQAQVGARHHTVPRFLLERWADKTGKVQTYGRIEQRFRPTNITNLAIRDFYTFIDLDGQKDSSMESILSEGVEGPAAAVLRDLLDPFAVPQPVQIADLATLAQFAAYQVVRTARHRRENELQAEWLAKTMARGHMSDAQLREWTITPHQNDTIQSMGEMAYQFMGLFACRPVALMFLDRPRLLIGDDPVVVNPGPLENTHGPDCFLTDAQIDVRMMKERRKKKGRRRRIEGRTVHFSHTVPRGLGTAPEIVLPVSPRAALLWGPLGDTPYIGDVDRVRLDQTESKCFADLLNDAACEQALDWIVTRSGDTDFTDRNFPPPGPLMRVCDGTNAASDALNMTPTRLRPARLW